MYESAQFAQRHQKLEEELLASQQASADLSKYLQEIQNTWDIFFNEAVKDLRERLEEIDVAAMLNLIEQEAGELN